MELFDKAFDAITKKLDLHMRRHVVLAGNVANSETPNYRAREVDFGNELERVLGADSSPLLKTDAKHIDVTDAGASRIVYDNTGAMGADGNNVDLDIVMGKLNENSRGYTNAATMMEMKLRLLRLAAQGGGGM